MNWRGVQGYLSSVQENSASDTYFLVSSVIMLIVVFVLYKTYVASRNIEQKLTEFASLGGDGFGRKLRLIEAGSDAYHINRKALGPLARIIDEYAVFTTDGSGVITYANERFIARSGYALSDLVGNTQAVNSSGVHSAEFWKDMWSRIANGKVWHGEICNKTKSGELYWLDMFIFPLSYVSDDDEGYICFSTDITAIKMQNERLRDENRKKEELLSRVEGMLLHSEKMASLGTIAAGIAHEINNPVAFIASNIKTLGEYCDIITMMCSRINFDAEGCNITFRERKEIKEVVRDFPEVIGETQDGIRRIQKIISDLKIFSHEQNDGFSPVELHKCIDAALNLARNEIKYRLEVKRCFLQYSPRVNGSETQLTQVFVNLFVNAAHAIEDKGTLEILTQAVGSGVVVKVIDDGCGIEPAIIKTIFEPFFTTKGVGKGTGLGLSISQDIIKRHGGNISVSSSLGVGTAFVIELPMLVEEGTCAA